MTVTFPHLGPAYLVVPLAMKELGIPVIVPPANDTETLDKGKAISPEEMCLPFKFMAGNLVQAYERGARRVMMPATMGPCRLGEYGELLKQVLDHAGCRMDWVLLDTPKAIGLKEWIRRLDMAGAGRQASAVASARILLTSICFIRKLDRLESKLKYMAGYAADPGECVRLLRKFRKELQGTDRMKAAFAVVKKYCNEAERIIPAREGTIPVTVLVTGEIYTSIEDAANQRLEEQLMLLGCSVRRPVTLSWWMDHTIKAALPNIFQRRRTGYLPYSIGGYAKETVEEIRHASDDGVIKIMPAGCMPEIVAKAASKAIEEEQGTKVLHLVFDEMQANAGYETRVEAFVDMLERRKRVFPRN